MLSKKIIIGSLGMLFLTGGLLFVYWRSTKSEIIRSDHKVPEVVLKTYDGQEVTLNAWKGKLLLVNVWASWCPFCKKELEDFAQLQKDFGDKIVIIAVNRGESLERVKQFSPRPEESPHITFLLDSGDALYKAIGGFSMPETIFVDQEGNIVTHKRGPMILEEMKRRTRETFGL